MSVRNLTEWRDHFLHDHVQAQNIEGGDFLSSETVVLVSGPPELDETQTPTLVPIGLVQNVQLSQNKQIQQLFEIGSRKPYFVPGRTVLNGGMSRILFDGPSLMYSLYMQSAAGGGSPAVTLPADYEGGSIPGEEPVQPTVDGGTGTVADTALEATPGYFFINLASAFFNKPLGLGFMLYDGEKQAYGGFYLEGVYIQQHTFSVASQQTVLVENVSLRATSLVPLDPSSIDFAG